MQLLSPKEAADRTENIVYFDTQETASGLDLTAAEIHRLTSSGALDFGGSEYEPAGTEAISPTKDQPDDDYGWWELREGTYLVRYNEGVNPGAGEVALIYPHERLLKAGAHHGAFRVDEPRRPLQTLLIVGSHGLRLKENCRISSMVVLGK